MENQVLWITVQKKDCHKKWTSGVSTLRLRCKKTWKTSCGSEVKNNNDMNTWLTNTAADPPSRTPACVKVPVNYVRLLFTQKPIKNNYSVYISNKKADNNALSQCSTASSSVWIGFYTSSQFYKLFLRINVTAQIVLDCERKLKSNVFG